ncbi:hypothetical protein BH23GEM6_BH23GEM6_28150 [soil metagenome]
MCAHGRALHCTAPSNHHFEDSVDRTLLSLITIFSDAKVGTLRPTLQTHQDGLQVGAADSPGESADHDEYVLVNAAARQR